MDNLELTLLVSDPSPFVSAIGSGNPRLDGSLCSDMCIMGQYSGCGGADSMVEDRLRIVGTELSKEQLRIVLGAPTSIIKHYYCIGRPAWSNG